MSHLGLLTGLCQCRHLHCPVWTCPVTVGHIQMLISSFIPWSMLCHKPSIYLLLRVFLMFSLTSPVFGRPLHHLTLQRWWQFREQKSQPTFYSLYFSVFLFLSGKKKKLKLCSHCSEDLIYLSFTDRLFKVPNIQM